ncbi:MAG: inositol monophosphatase family protein [Kofleriaceae bacterium]
MDIDLEQALAVARRAAEAAATAALAHVGTGVPIEYKADESPVTAADREAEAAIVAILREAFPTHAITGEESGELAGDRRSRWIVDPVDGTRGFTRGGMFWGPLIALEHDGAIVAGALGLPVLGEIYVAARGLGCWRGSERITVSTTARWADATLSLGEQRRIIDQLGLEAYLRIVRGAQTVRSFGDVGAAAMLLAGRADAWIECGVSEWDVAPQRILVEEAGGRFLELPRTGGKYSVIATNGHVHDELVALLRPE